ncbi:hypothetical protein FIBSPDRAFT_1041616 [Athelia psychrophila]|uniref:Uncharacterized protein n=1 Tax=Athelia psychrophila TaxID=1759441 RepID=A0A166NL18_9AGAM|nr:hypothetical protein FIBSPDRAFT_1041616 [Fibularhizoctonia sp. CBS 109695]
MTSRNPNVHALESGTQNVTRAQLDHIDTEYESEQEPIPDLPLLTKRLRELVTEELGDPSVAINAKRRKLDSADESADMEDAPNAHSPFFLLSSWTTPQDVILDPKPPPPVASTEPDVEDNKTQAKQRRQQSKIAAIDYDRIQTESQKHYPPSMMTQGRLLQTKQSSPIQPSSLPVIVVTETHQPSRRTRPPVSATSPGSRLALSVLPGIPVVPVHCSVDTGNRTPRSRHRRGKKAPQEIPQPTFWRPDPALKGKGKSAGYALGYPGNWLALGARSKAKQYGRDTMRKGVLACES